MHFQICGNNDGNIINVFKNCISISVATVLEVSKMTVPICTSHWCLVMTNIMTLFLTVSSFYRIFSQVSKTFNSTVALQVGFLKPLGDVATVLLDLVCLSFFMSFQTDWMMIRSDLCVEHWLLSDIHWIITINGKMFGNVN